MIEVILTRDRPVRHYYEALERALITAGIGVRWGDGSYKDAQYGAIYVGGRYVGHFSIFDHGIPAWIADSARKCDARLILNVSPEPGPHAVGLPCPVIPAGYLAWILDGDEPDWIPDVMERTNPVMARMRTHQHRKERAGKDWSKARKVICDDADAAGIPTQKIGTAAYLEELRNSRVGVNWRGICPINHRVVEYLRYGLVIVSDPLDFEVLPGVRLQDGVHALFSKEPDDVMMTADLMLENEAEMRFMAGEAQNFYEQHLTPSALGSFYRKTIEEAS